MSDSNTATQPASAKDAWPQRQEFSGLSAFLFSRYGTAWNLTFRAQSVRRRCIDGRWKAWHQLFLSDHAPATPEKPDKRQRRAVDSLARETVNELVS